MRVEVVRRGGLAGVALRGAVETAELPPETAAPAEAALRQLPFDGPPPTPRHPDSFTYAISVSQDDGSTRTAMLDEAELPEGLRPLVEAAMGHAEIE
jgi:hypothetical protein